VSAGESVVDAALREAAEEIGLEVNASELVPLGVIREQCVLNDGAYLDNEIHEIFVVRREVDPGSLRLDPEEVAEVALVAPGDLGRYALVPHPEEYALLRSYLQTC
jgi:8-oxo-dGTP pyrophosphatase MutT (NUDIX family)